MLFSRLCAKSFDAFRISQQVMFDVRPTAKAPNQDPLRSEKESGLSRPFKVQVKDGNGSK
jgi:hypothetical protein